MAMEATIFTGWIYDHLLPHAEKVKVAHPRMLRAIAASKKKNDQIDARKIADLLRCDLLPECHMASTEIRDRRRTLQPSMRPAAPYAAADSNAAARVTAITLISSSCPKVCAALATSAALLAVRSSSCTRSNPNRFPFASIASTIPSDISTSLSPAFNSKCITEDSAPSN